MSDLFTRLLRDNQPQQVKPDESPAPLANNKPSIASNDSTTARQQTVMTERQHDSTTTKQQSPAQSYIQPFLAAKATQKTTLRYPAALMTEIDDAMYQIRKTYGVTLSKNEIFILGLASVLFDFKRNADHSLLNEQLIRGAKTAR